MTSISKQITCRTSHDSFGLEPGRSIGRSRTNRRTRSGMIQQESTKLSGKSRTNQSTNIEVVRNENLKLISNQSKKRYMSAVSNQQYNVQRVHVGKTSLSRTASLRVNEETLSGLSRTIQEGVHACLLTSNQQ